MTAGQKTTACHHTTTKVVMSVRILLSTLGALFIASSLFASQRPITMDEAIQLAIKQNQNITIARLAVSKASAQRKEALGNALPSLNISASYQRNIEAPVFFVPNFADPTSKDLVPMRFGATNSYNAGASLNQILFNSAVFTGIGAADVYVSAAQEQYRAAVAEVVTETKKRYYGVLAARSYAEVAQQALDNALANKKNIDALFAEGLVAEFDAIRVNVFVENVRPELTAAQAGYRNAVSALMTYLSIDLADTVNPQSVDLPTPGDLPSASDAMSMALKSNYELTALEKGLEVSHEFVNVYRSTYYPSLSLFGQFTNTGQSNDFSNWINASQLFVGLSLNFNIFNGFKEQAKVEQAQADYLTAKERLLQLKNMIRLQVSATLNDLASAKERIDAQQTTVDQAQRGYEISQVRYNEGTGSLLEINDSQTALAKARVNRLGALYDYYVRLADFERVTGQVPEKYMRLAAM